ncbi:MAG: class I SAM-dependent methyltransferase [Nitrospira sp.]
MLLRCALLKSININFVSSKMALAPHNTLHQAVRSCPICSTASTFVFTSKHHKQIYQCGNEKCGHFFTPISRADQGICVRDENIEEESNQSLNIYSERNERLLSLFKSYLGNRESPLFFLDYGAGNAHISRTFKDQLQNNVRIYCLEANPGCKDLYEKYGLLQLSTLNDLPEKVDLVYMIEVIEHLDDPIKAMSQLKQVLKNDGMIFLSTPVGKLQESATNAYDTLSHLHFFTEKSLNLTLAKSGFSEIHFTYYPEMYPLPSQSVVNKPKNLVKDLVKKALPKFSPAIVNKLKNLVKSLVQEPLAQSSSAHGIGHLVGITRPIGHKPTPQP